MTDIRQKVDQLAMDAMLAQGQESVAALLAALSEIAAEAQQAGMAGVPALIEEMCATLTAQPNDADVFLNAIIRLQQAIEEAPQAPAPVAEQPATPKSTAMHLAADPELLGDFLVESRDHLTNIESQLLTLEQDPANTDAIHTIFRGFHTIKGLAGFLEFPAIQAVAHEVETLLDKARNGELAITPAVVDVVLEGADYLKTDLHRIELRGCRTEYR